MLDQPNWRREDSGFPTDPFHSSGRYHLNLSVRQTVGVAKITLHYLVRPHPHYLVQAYAASKSRIDTLGSRTDRVVASRHPVLWFVIEWLPYVDGEGSISPHARYHVSSHRRVFSATRTRDSQFDRE